MNNETLTYNCILCDYNTKDINLFISHRSCKNHKAKKELKYMTLKFEDKLSDTKIEEMFIKLEHNVIMDKSKSKYKCNDL
jgi:hypothetical protein